MSDAKQIAALLDEAAETPHRVYRITDDVNDHCASSDAEFLLRCSELPSIVGSAPVRSELLDMFVKLDKDQTTAGASELGRSTTRHGSCNISRAPTQPRSAVG